MMRLLLIAILFLVSTCALNATLYVEDCRDTYLDEENPDKDYSTVSKLCWRTRDTIEAWTLLHYSIFNREGGPIPDNVDIESATFHTKFVSDPCNIRFHDYNTPWNDTDTFNSVGMIKPEEGRDFDGRQGYRLNVEGEIKDHVFDVTESVQSWSSGKENHGWIFLQGNTVPHECNKTDYGILDGCDSGPVYSPWLDVVYHPTFSCEIFSDLTKSRRYDSQVPAYSNVCLFCESNIPNGPDFSLYSNSLLVQDKKIAIEKQVDQEDSIQFCFVMPFFVFTQKRDVEQVTVQVSFVYLPNNRQVSMKIPYRSRPQENITCDTFKCENGSVVIPGDLEIWANHVTGSNVTIQGDLTIFNNGVITITDNSSISVTGCTSLAGTLELGVDTYISTLREIRVLQSECINGTFDVVTLRSNVQQDSDPCTTLDTTQKQENGFLSVLVSRRNTCGSSDNDPPIYVWFAAAGCLLALIIVISVIVIGFYVRRKHSKDEEERLDMALADATATPSKINTPQTTLDSTAIQ